MHKKLWLGLRTKVLLVVLGTALVTSSLFALGINAVLKDRFASYLDQGIEQQNQRIVGVIEELYAQYRSWVLVAAQFESVAPTINNVIRVRDLENRIVLDSTLGRMHTWMMRQGASGPGMMRGRWDRSFSGLVEEGNAFSYPIEVEGKKVGSAEIIVLGENGRWSRADLEFRETIQDAVVQSSIIAGLLALLLSLAFASRITNPILEITKVAERLRAGNFSARAKVNGRDELAALAGTFNAMAGRLEKTDRLRKKFTADVAHELRTPVTTIRSYIEGFQDGVLQPTAQRLAELEEETIRLSELISDLQDLTLVESDEGIIERISFDLAAEARHLISRMAHQFTEKGVALEVSGEHSAVVHGDRKLLLRAVGNLISNALKYTDSGGRVGVLFVVKDNKITISVSDTGAGIAEADLPYIFDRFYRADPSRARSTGGSGIGLALVKEIAAAHGGSISAKSAVNEGSTFILELPLGGILTENLYLTS